MKELGKRRRLYAWAEYGIMVAIMKSMMKIRHR